jgi:RNA polymerase sigma-70 factor (ECF subfamily)
MPPPLDVPACVDGMRRGDARAAEALVAHTWPLVLRIARAHRPRGLAPEDLAQEVFLKMFAQLPRYSPRDGVPFEHWLARLAVRACLDALRTERRRPRFEPLELSEGARRGLAWLRDERGPAVDEALAARELADALLAQLPPRDRLLLVWLDVEERSTEEIAGLTGWSRTLVKVRAFRARRRLRRAAEALGGPRSGSAA